MSDRLAARLAWGAMALALLGLILAVYLGVAANPYRPEMQTRTIDIIWAFSLFTIPLVGPLIASRQPRNPMGWLLCLFGFALAWGLALSEYGHYSRSVPDGELPADAWAAWASRIIFPLAFGALEAMILVFPNGTLPSRRWRWLPWAMGITFSISVLASALAPGSTEADSPANPIGLTGLPQLADIGEQAFNLFLLLGLAALIAPFKRFYRARGELRQQLKWFAYSCGLAMLIIAASIGLDTVADPSEVIGIAITSAAFLVLAMGLAVSILRYRLYDIDVVINRTLVYGLLSALLAAVYLGIVFVLQQVLAGVTAESDLAIAGSTLAVAALFRPLRARVQRFIDLRFYRSKYDAETTLQRFSAHLRDQVDLDSLLGELVSVVRTTMQPAHASIWMRATTERPYARTSSPSPDRSMSSKTTLPESGTAIGGKQ